VPEERFGPYVVFERLGAGGMATVHRASIELENDETREVALKRLLPQFADDKRFVDDLIREGKLAAQLEHPNIVRILELGRIGRTYFIAMDLVRGQPLMNLMRRAYQKRMPPSLPIVLALVSEMLDALDHAHAAKIVHRDLTPSNLIITNEGHLKIIDFGVAKALSGALQTSSGLAKGKLGYMSMEAVSGKQVDERADIFSAGVVMWELTVLKRLFRGNTDIELINAMRVQQIDPPSLHNPNCPRALDDLIMKALQKPRDARWSSVGEMIDILDGIKGYYGCASARDVVGWVAQLRAETAPSGVRLDSENTEVGLTDDDLFEEVERPELAQGSDAGTYDDLDPDIVEVVDDAPKPPRFKDADTVVSVTTFPPRKG
jgi:serine/threonine protein kinase